MKPPSDAPLKGIESSLTRLRTHTNFLVALTFTMVGLRLTETDSYEILGLTVSEHRTWVVVAIVSFGLIYAIGRLLDSILEHLDELTIDQERDAKYLLRTFPFALNPFGSGNHAVGQVLGALGANGFYALLSAHMLAVIWHVFLGEEKGLWWLALAYLILIMPQWWYLVWRMMEVRDDVLPKEDYSLRRAWQSNTLWLVEISIVVLSAFLGLSKDSLPH